MRNRQSLLVALTLSLTLVACGAGQRVAGPDQPFGERVGSDSMSLAKWLMGYYRAPAPQDIGPWIEAAHEAGLLRDETRMFGFLGFAATLFADNPDRLEAWLTVTDKLPPGERKPVLLALWLADTEAARAALAVAGRREQIAGPNYFRLDTTGAPPRLDQISVLWGFLDVQWGRFFASGDPMAVVAIAALLGDDATGASGGAGGADFRVATVRRAAAWSLESNCRTDTRVRSICELLCKGTKLTPAARTALRSILAKLPERES